jgi:hypothetical protein
MIDESFEATKAKYAPIYEIISNAGEAGIPVEQVKTLVKSKSCPDNPLAAMERVGFYLSEYWRKIEFKHTGQHGKILCVVAFNPHRDIVDSWLEGWQ